jgi:Putative zinc-finger
MTSSTECSRLRISLGVYVLGAIEPAERAAVDAHLSGCPRCRDELASLAGMPAMLGRVTEEQIAQLGPPPEELLDSVLAKAAGESRSRRRRSRVWGLAAAAALVVGTGAGVRAVTDTDGQIARPRPSATVSAEPGEAVRTLNGADPATGVRAAITMRPEEWGTAFLVNLSGAPFGAHCHLVAIDKKGRNDIAGGWQVQYYGSASFPGSSMIRAQDIAAVEVRTAEGKRLLRVQA